MINIYDDLNKLEGTFRQTEQFSALKTAIEEVKQNDEAVALFAKFRELQMTLQEKQMKGEDLGERQLLYAQKTAQLAQQNEAISKMLMAEMALSELVQEINRVLTKPIQAMYDGIQ